MNELHNAEKALEIINKHYDLGKIDYCMFIRRGANDTYLVEAEQKKYIFRIYLNGKYYIKSNDDYRFELELINHLHGHGVSVSLAIPTTQGDFLGVVNTKKDQRTFALFHYAEGISLNRKAVTNKQCFEMGSALAKIHLTADSFKTSFDRYSLDVKYLVEEPIRLLSEAEKFANSEEDIKHGLRILEKLQPIDNYIDRINGIGTDSGKFGIIHADLHLGNVHFRGDNLTIFDFDHCAFGWRAYDLAISYYLPEEKRYSMIEGYESKRPLSPEEHDSLMDLANLRNLWDIGDILAMKNITSNDN